MDVNALVQIGCEHWYTEMHIRRHIKWQLNSWPSCNLWWLSSLRFWGSRGWYWWGFEVSEMWCCVTGWVVPGVSEDHIPIIFKSNESTKSVLHRHEGTTVLSNLGNYLPINMELHPRILESVQTVVCRISSIRFHENLFGGVSGYMVTDRWDRWSTWNRRFAEIWMCQWRG